MDIDVVRGVGIYVVGNNTILVIIFFLRLKIYFLYFLNLIMNNYG